MKELMLEQIMALKNAPTEELQKRYKELYSEDAAAGFAYQCLQGEGFHRNEKFEGIHSRI